MIKDTHYGVVPGCGDKPTLLKPGAEKLLMTFRIAAEPQIEDLSTADQIRYRVAVRGTSIGSGAFIGTGIGECSSNENKYKWRNAVCEEEFNETSESMRREVWKKSGAGGYKTKQVRTSPSDIANTVLKMAKKRALVDFTLTATAASDIFTQDIDEMEQELAAAVAGGEHVATIPPAPQRKSPIVQEKQEPKTEKQPSTHPPMARITIQDVLMKTGTSEKGKAWTLFRIVDGLGNVYSTFDTKLYEVALACKAEEKQAEINYTNNGKGNSLTSIVPVE